MTPEERFWSKVRKTRTCWIWVGAKSRSYGHFWLKGRVRKAHVVAWEWENGPVPNGMELDHVSPRCKNTLCVRPSHLEPVTHLENVRRGDASLGTGMAAINRDKTHCPQGHPYDEANTYRRRRPSGIDRICRACRRLGMQRRRKEKA